MLKILMIFKLLKKIFFQKMLKILMIFNLLKKIFPKNVNFLMNFIMNFIIY